MKLKDILADRSLSEKSDHEVGMAQNQLKAIHQAAGDLEHKIGDEEINLPGWIQAHITSAYEYLKQANDGYHKLDEAQSKYTIQASGGSWSVIDNKTNRPDNKSVLKNGESLAKYLKDQNIGHLVTNLDALDKKFHKVALSEFKSLNENPNKFDYTKVKQAKYGRGLSIFGYKGRKEYYVGNADTDKEADEMAQYLDQHGKKAFDNRYGQMAESSFMPNEESEGLWANIHAKRKRGEKPATPGDKEYPKTLDIDDEMFVLDKSSKNESIKLKELLNERQAKQAVAGGKVQRFITGYNQTIAGKKYSEIEYERVEIDNNRDIVTLRVDSPKEIAGKLIEVPFKTLRRGSFMATPIQNAL